MWKNDRAGRYTQKRLSYPSDVTDEEWALLEPLIPGEQAEGRPQEIARREIVNAILYVVRSGCSWRMLPHDLPRWFTAYAYFRRWKRMGIWEQVNTALRRDLRVQMGRDPEPSAASIDSQSIRSSSVRGDARGIDGGKKIRGRKRHLFVDSQGLLLGVTVGPANTHDQWGARQLLSKLRDKLPRLQVIWGDHSYQGGFEQWVRDLLGDVRVDIKKALGAVAKGAEPSAEEKAVRPTGYVPHRKRWVVERTHAWVTHFRRLGRDYEGTHTSSEAFISLAMSKLMLARLTSACP
jgi:putative transposase